MYSLRFVAKNRDIAAIIEPGTIVKSEIGTRSARFGMDSFRRSS
jgi:hypothetical protein